MVPVCQVYLDHLDGRGSYPMPERMVTVVSDRMVVLDILHLPALGPTIKAQIGHSKTLQDCKWLPRVHLIGC